MSDALPTVRRGRINGSTPGSASIEKTTTATSTEIGEIVRMTNVWRKMPPVKTDEETAERLDMFFEHCATTGEVPTVEKMALALGVTRQCLYKWQHEENFKARGEMISLAKEMLASIDAELAARGKIPPVTYIFRSKNYYGMRDQTDVILRPGNPLDPNMSREELLRRYALNAPED